MPLKEEFRSQGNFLFKHRSYLPLIIVAVGLAVYIYTLDSNETTIEQFNNYNIELIYLFVAFFGQFIRAYSVGFAA